MLNQSNLVDLSSYSSNQTTYTQKKISEEKKDEVLKELKRNKLRWYNAYNMNLQNFRTDKYFYMGQLQWDSYASSQYQQLGKTPYTFNLLKPIVRQLQGEMASMQPSISLSAHNAENIDPELLILMTDFLRGQLYHTKASEAYNECFINQCIGGWGVLEISTDYEDSYSFAQAIRVESSPDPLKVGFDPSAKLKTKTDGKFCYKDYYMTKEEYRATFNKEPPPMGSMTGSPSEFMAVWDNDIVIVTDYYRREYKSKTLVQLSNNDNYMVEVLEKDVPAAQENYIKLMTTQGIEMDLIPPLVITNRRKTKVSTIHCYQCVWNEVLTHKIWAAKDLPMIFVPGNSLMQDGKEYTESYIQAAKDAQMSYNYAMSEIYNAIPRARREQVWMTRTQAKGHEEFLRYPDRQQSHGEYNPDPLAPNGPIFRPPEELPQSLFVAAQQAKQAVYDALGIMPVNGTELPNNLAAQTVGRIITQGNLTFAKLLNNLFDGMQQLGKIFLELVPKIYDMERIIHAVDAAGNSRSVLVNTVQNGQEKYMLDSMVYHLEVKPVPSFAIQQEELRQNLFQLSQLNPQNAPLISDLIASTLNTPIAPLLVKRLQTLVPPNVIAAEKGMPTPPQPPNPQVELVQGQIAKLKAEEMLAQTKANTLEVKNELLAQQLNQKHNESLIKAQLETQKVQADAQKTALQSSAEIQKAQLDHDAKILPALAKFHEAHKKNSVD